MPVLTPTGLQFFINDLINEVLLRTENRTTDTNRAAVWIRDALLEISGSPDYRDDFVQLEELGPIVQLTPQVQEYPSENFIQLGDSQLNCCDMMVWTDYPSNTVRRKLDVSHYQKTDRFTPVFSIPTQWYRFADTIGFDPVPDQPYQVQARMVRMHPINDNNLPQTIILLPRDWNEVLTWNAVMRGFGELMEYEKAAAVYKMLHGDPKDPSQPGLFYSVKRIRRKEQWRMESRLTLVHRNYGWGR